VRLVCLVASKFLSATNWIFAIMGFMVDRGGYKNTPYLATITNTSMSYYSPPPTSAFSGAVRSSTPDTHQRPPSVLMEKLNLYSSDVYAGSPSTASPLQPYPVQAARFSGRSYSPRPESPAQIGKTASGWSFPQAPAPESPLPVQKTFKTFLQWKAEAQATTADYQRNGFPSPVAWVLIFIHFSLIRNLRTT
jgi:hypothetical protein